MSDADGRTCPYCGRDIGIIGPDCECKTPDTEAEGAVEKLIEAASKAFSTIAKWSDQRCPIKEWQGLLDAARAELAERGEERVVTLGDGDCLCVHRTQGKTGLPEMTLVGPCSIAIRPLPDAPEPVPEKVTPPLRYAEDCQNCRSCDTYHARCNRYGRAITGHQVCDGFHDRLEPRPLEDQDAEA